MCITSSLLSLALQEYGGYLAYLVHAPKLRISLSPFHGGKPDRAYCLWRPCQDFDPCKRHFSPVRRGTPLPEAAVN